VDAEEGNVIQPIAPDSNFGLHEVIHAVVPPSLRVGRR